MSEFRLIRSGVRFSWPASRQNHHQNNCLAEVQLFCLFPAFLIVFRRETISSSLRARRAYRFGAFRRAEKANKAKREEQPQLEVAPFYPLCFVLLVFLPLWVLPKEQQTLTLRYQLLACSIKLSCFSNVLF